MTTPDIIAPPPDFSMDAISSIKIPEKRMTKGEVRVSLLSFFKRYKGARPKRVVILNNRLERGPVDNERQKYSKGQYSLSQDTLFLYADMLAGPDTLSRVIRHELFVHRGLGLFSGKEQAEIIRAVLASRENVSDKRIQNIWKIIDEFYGHRSDLVRVEEFLAVIAENDSANWTPLP